MKIVFKNVIKILVTFKPIVRFWCPSRLRNLNISLTNSIFDGRLSNYLYYLAVINTRALQPYDWHGLGPSQWKLDGLALLIADLLRLNSTTRQNLTIWDPSRISICVESITSFMNVGYLFTNQIMSSNRLAEWSFERIFLKRMT